MYQENTLFKETKEIELAKHVRMSEKGLDAIRKPSHNDDTLKELAKVINLGWPEHA